MWGGVGGGVEVGGKEGVYIYISRRVVDEVSEVRVRV